MRRSCLLAGLMAGAPLACGPAVGETSGTDGSSTTGTSTGGPTTGGSSGDAPTTSEGSSSAASEGTSTGTTGPSDPAVCAAATAIELKDASATPDTGPSWEPGEGVTIGVTLHNAGSEDFLSYPGIRVQADHPGVTAAMPENWLFALLVGQDNALAVSFTAAADVPAPSVVRFTIEVVVLNEDCPGLMQAVLPVDLQ